MSNVEEIERLLSNLSLDQRKQVFSRLRQEFPIHPLERRIGAEAEVILEAFDRAGELTYRMFRGVIAEAAFAMEVLKPLEARGWRDETPKGDKAFDFLTRDEVGPVSIQVKLQRSQNGVPLVTAPHRSDGIQAGRFLVETDKSRRGTNAAGESTRGYLFGSFDVLAVSLQPSTGDWSKFLYTVERWLWPRPGDTRWIYKYQPVPMTPSEDWTDDFLTVVSWLRSGAAKRIS